MVKKWEMCCGCGACYQICPVGCITMEADKEGFLYAAVDTQRCIGCNMCETVCPALDKKEPSEEYRDAYVGYVIRDDLRLAGSSGGIFSALALYIIKSGGVVYGAAFDQNQNVEHIRVDSESDMAMLRGSKYVQSRINDTYKMAKMDIEQGRNVLYSGTECQIVGLKKYLGREYDNLYLVDVLCHGVPSPRVWSKYLEWLGEEKNIRRINFRDKKTGWNHYSFDVKYEDGSEYSCMHNSDVFMQLFLRNVILRPSCYTCKFKGIDRESDITLGDAWDIEKKMSNMDDDKGTSIIITHSFRGAELLESIRNDIYVCPVDLNAILPKNADSRKSVEPHPKRNLYFGLFSVCGKRFYDIWKVIQKYHRVRQAIKNRLGKRGC